MTLILWFGFIGAWLLVAGPLYQGVHELQEQEVDREKIEAATAGIKPGPRPSGWWWLLPPVMIVRLRRRSDAFWREAFDALPPEQAVQIIGVRSKMYGWFMVSAGASFLALKETWELSHHYEWSLWVYLGIILVLGLLAISNAVLSNSSRDAWEIPPEARS